MVFRIDRITEAFFLLLRAGLWEKDVEFTPYGDIDFGEILRLAEQQSVVGLVTAGVEHISDTKPPRKDVLPFIEQTIQQEQYNQSMNGYLEWLIERLSEEGIYAVLVKGQGIAQCYERPLWRSSGDIDLLLSAENYERAKKMLSPLALGLDKEFVALRHLGMTMVGGIILELHGTLHSRLSKRIDDVIDDVQRDVLFCERVRSWNNGCTTVFLPSPDEDVIFVFTHILHHFYIEGVGLRQICDWCRLLWTYKDSLDASLLEQRLRKMGLISEWRAFATLAIEWLGMPVEAMPLHSDDAKWNRKASQIMKFVLKSGNFGYNRQIERSSNRMVGKIQAALYKMRDFVRHTKVFPLDSVIFLFYFVGNGVRLTIESNDNDILK